MRPYLAVARTGLTSLLLHPQRALVTIACLVAILLPYLVGLGISRGVREQAEVSIRFGADLYVSGERLGRPAPVPLDAVDRIRALPGVAGATPRIIARIEIGKDRAAAVLVGLAVHDFPPELECIAGRLYKGGNANEIVVGSDLARRLLLEVGSPLPPTALAHYRSRQAERNFEVVGIFRSDVPMWQARLVVTSFETAAHLLDQPGLATDVLVRCRTEYQDEVERAILRDIGPSLAPNRLRITTRDDLALLLPQGLEHREGIFTVLFVLAFVVGILVVMVTSGFGLSERRREIGILKATGWQTDELLLRSLVESLLISLAGAALSIVLAFVWLRWLNGYWIASVFIPGVDAAPGFRVPFRLTPIPALLAALLALVMVLTGSLYSTWRAATTSPREAMR